MIPVYDCRDLGHDWPIEIPGILHPDREMIIEALTQPLTQACQRCGVVRTDYPNGKRIYQVPLT